MGRRTAILLAVALVLLAAYVGALDDPEAAGEADGRRAAAWLLSADGMGIAAVICAALAVRHWRRWRRDEGDQTTHR